MVPQHRRLLGGRVIVKVPFLTPSWPLQGAVGGLQRLASAVRRGQRAAHETSAGSHPLENYVSTVSQWLAVFRFVSFAMGAGLFFALNPSDQQPSLLGQVVLVVGVFNVYCILRRFDPARPRRMIQWTNLSIDTSLSITLTLISGGLDSPFLIYSLSPILTASLLLNLRSALAAAGATAVAVSGAHALPWIGVSNLPHILSENYLVLALLFSAVSLLVVCLPFLANLSWQRRLRFESLAVERQRLRREVHDNVAQTLAFLNMKMKLSEQRTSHGQSPITQTDVSEICRIVERTYLAVRDYLDGTGEEEDEPLLTRISTVADQWSRDTGLPAHINVTGDEGELPVQVKFQLVQITREALANVAKHAYPQNTWVEVKCEPAQVQIRVRDDGRGFAASGLKGHGMGIMSERAAMAQASVDINSAPGEGTEVILTYCRDTKNGDS